MEVFSSTSLSPNPKPPALREPVLGYNKSSMHMVYIGIMEKKMETTVICWGNIGIMEKKMETTIRGYIGIM